MKVLVIDNYDSFTYNLCHLVARVTGTFPLVRRNDELTLQSFRDLNASAVLLSPGPGHPENQRDFGIGAEILRTAAVPVLGVCLGHQGIAHFSGASVSLADRPMHGLTSRVRHCGTGLFAGVPQDFAAVRYHSFVVRSPLSPDLEALAWTEEGEIMALRHRTRPFWGVQFHPESISTEFGARILENFFEQVHAIAAPVMHPIEGELSAERIYVDMFSRDENSFWLDSSGEDNEQGRFSYLGGSSVPGAYLVKYDAQLQVLDAPGAVPQQRLFAFLRNHLHTRRSPGRELRFEGGFAGYMGFELKRDCGYSCAHASQLPDAQFLFTPAVVIYDHASKFAFIALSESTPELLAWAEQTKSVWQPGQQAPPAVSAAKSEFQPRLAPAEYRERVLAAQREILHGESYEICLTDILTGPAVPDALGFYRRLRRRNPAPYSAFLKFGSLQIACSSPERFLRVEPSGRVTSKPIKGTAPRSSDPEQDEAYKRELLASEKEGAEHLMIVDLVRNDLGKVCEAGSIEVPVFRNVESYARVHQLVSTVEGQLREGCNAVDAIEAAFPAGSMTGAPKARTLEILDRLEAGPRGVYSGSIGWIAMDGTCDLNVVIRTAVMTEDRTEIGSGGAIVAGSEPDAELAELRLKVAPLTELHDEPNAAW